MSRRRITPLNEATSFVKEGLDKEGFVKIFINDDIGKHFGSGSTNYRIEPQLPHRTQYHHRNIAGDHMELIPCYPRNLEANGQLVP